MSEIILENDDFTIWQPACAVFKAGEADGERRIGGYCSTEHVDRQGEVVLQRGLEFDEFVKFGYFNDNHNQATAAVVGIPDKAEYRQGHGWYTEGRLLKGVKRADEIWELAKSLEPTERRLGFSIEGKVIERRDNYIVKAKIRNVAVTNAPVNTSCSWSLLSKSFHPAVVEKALSAGGLSGPGAGRVIIPQDLETGHYHKEKFEDEDGECDSCPTCGTTKHKKSRKTRKALLSLEEGMCLIKRVRPCYSDELCAKIVEFASL
jgi:hypothetical protein